MVEDASTSPTSEEHYLPMDCPVCGRRRVLYDPIAHTVKCEKCKRELHNMDVAGESAALHIVYSSVKENAMSKSPGWAVAALEEVIEDIAEATGYEGEKDGDALIEHVKARVQQAESPTGLRAHLLNLLAVIHSDGGHRTDRVGMDQSVLDAKRVVSDLKVKAMGIG